MTQASQPRRPRPAASREARLKAALKANIARRKAQAEARASGADTEHPDGGRERE